MAAAAAAAARRGTGASAGGRQVARSASSLIARCWWCSDAVGRRAARAGGVATRLVARWRRASSCWMYSRECDGNGRVESITVTETCVL